MKKLILLIAAVAFLASCSQHTCATYIGSKQPHHHHATHHAHK